MEYYKICENLRLEFFNYVNFKINFLLNIIGSEAPDPIDEPPMITQK